MKLVRHEFLCIPVEERLTTTYTHADDLHSLLETSFNDAWHAEFREARHSFPEDILM